MVAFLTIWTNPSKGSRVEKIECKELIIKDGPKVECDGEVDAQLFHVIAADGIFHNVATIEVV